MRKWLLLSFVIAVSFSGVGLPFLPLAQRIGRCEPEKLPPARAVHGGAPGGVRYGGSRLSRAALDRFQTNFTMIDGGLMQPKGGIGYHFSLDHEDGFIILDDDAGEYTINGHTARLKGPVGVPCPMRAAHGYYNPTDQPKEFINIWVSTKKGVTTNPDAGNNLLESYPLEKKPSFFVADYDRARLQPAPNYHGGTGTARYRRVVPPEFFQTNWGYHDHLLLPSGASDGLHAHAGVEEIYFVLKGNGTAIVNSESAPIKRGDAVPVYLNEPHSFAPSSAGEIEFIVFGIAMQKGVLDTRVIK